MLSLMTMFASVALAVGDVASKAASTTTGFVNSLMFWKSEGFFLFLTDFMTAFIVLIIGWIVIKIFLNVIKKILKKTKNMKDLLRDYLLKIVKIIAWVLLALTVLSQLGLDMWPLIAGLGITGIVLGFALRDSISNLFAGSMIILNQPFTTGDFVLLGALSGTVKAMDLASVKLVSTDGKNITISNNLVWGSPVTNFSNMEKRRVDIIVGVPYDTDLKVAKEVFTSVIASYPEVLDEPGITVEIAELADSSINFAVKSWVKTADYWKVMFRFNGEITGELAEKNIFLPFPQLDVHLDGNN
ncbi:MAG: mechanosensitive ion channel family protein [Spirochaetaceae bacterium]|nr:mechanosensitive ion channel family protein [Spirochaetaceae bacterium]